MIRNITKFAFNSITGSNARTVSQMGYKTLAVTQPSPYVHQVELNRPDRLNAFSNELFLELKNCFDALNENPECRAIVFSGAGKLFSAGLDLKDAMILAQEIAQIEDPARKGQFLEQKIKSFQDAISSLETCAKPVIAAIHSACIGAGINLIATADIRYCSNDAWFSVKEIDLGLAADIGALQRLPKVIGNQSLVRELCYTGRKMDSKEAVDCGLIGRVFNNRVETIKASIKLAEEIASKSPVAIQATKKNLIYSLDHTNQEGLDHIRQINKLNLQSEDFANAAMAQATKGDPPVFSKLSKKISFELMNKKFILFTQSFE